MQTLGFSQDESQITNILPLCRHESAPGTSGCHLTIPVDIPCIEGQIFFMWICVVWGIFETSSTCRKYFGSFADGIFHHGVHCDMLTCVFSTANNYTCREHWVPLGRSSRYGRYSQYFGCYPLVVSSSGVGPYGPLRTHNECSFQKFDSVFLR